MADEPDHLPNLSRDSSYPLNRREAVDYKEYRRQVAWWLLEYGKDPEKAEGYAEDTIRVRIYLIDRFYNHIWESSEAYTTWVSPDHAQRFVGHLVGLEYSNSYKNSWLKAVQNLYKYQHHVHGTEEWKPPFRFTEEKTKPQDYLTKEERRKIRDASLTYGSVPNYHSVTPDAREEWKLYLAQRFGKPRSEVEISDWERANSWKIPSLVWVSLDAGLRPVEVERSVLGWVDLDNNVLRIPKSDSAKNTENWTVALRERTGKYLGKWLKERAEYEIYEDSDSIWLTRQGNPYQSGSLRYVLHRLCDLAGIEYENRRMSWYTIRHSLGTYMTREEDLAATAAQMRHKSITSTMVYDHAPVENRRDGSVEILRELQVRPVV